MTRLTQQHEVSRLRAKRLDRKRDKVVHAVPLNRLRFRRLTPLTRSTVPAPHSGANRLPLSRFVKCLPLWRAASLPVGGGWTILPEPWVACASHTMRLTNKTGRCGRRARHQTEACGLSVNRGHRYTTRFGNVSERSTTYRVLAFQPRYVVKWLRCWDITSVFRPRWNTEVAQPIFDTRRIALHQLCDLSGTATLYHIPLVQLLTSHRFLPTPVLRSTRRRAKLRSPRSRPIYPLLASAARANHHDNSLAHRGRSLGTVGL